MSPVAHIRNSIEGFHPKNIPLMSRLSYRRELISWAFMPLMLSGLQAGTISIFLKKTYAGVSGVSPAQLNFAVSLLVAAKAIGFLASFLWASLSRGRHKVHFMVVLQVATACAVMLVACAPLSAGGLWLVTGLCILAWTIWSGVMTLRTGVWRANYPQEYRPRIAGRISSIDGLVGAVAGFSIGLCLDWDPMLFRALFVAMGVTGLMGAALYRRMPFRRLRRHLESEWAADTVKKPALSPLAIWRVLRADGWYRGYMSCMFTLGFGNLMLHPILAIALADEFDVGYGSGILISTVLPLLLMIVAIPFWSSRLERMHVIHFRSIHAWSFVTVSGLVFGGVLFHQIALLYLAAVCLGVGYGGGVLAWNLGHQHFSSAERDAEYMGVHITLTGIRGVIGPILGVQLYEYLNGLVSQTQAFSVCFGICLGANLIGAIGFGILSQLKRKDEARSGPGLQKAAS